MKRLTRILLRRADRRGEDPPPPQSSPATSAVLSTARYDKLPLNEVLGHLHELRPADLAALGAHERAHQNRAALLAHIDALLHNEPWPGYDALDVDGVRFGLDGAERDRFLTVLVYEQAHRNRAGVVLAAQQKPT